MTFSNSTLNPYPTYTIHLNHRFYGNINVIIIKYLSFRPKIIDNDWKVRAPSHNNIQNENVWYGRYPDNFPF